MGIGCIASSRTYSCVLAMGPPMSTGPSPLPTSSTADQMVVSVGPYMFHTEAQRSRSASANSRDQASPPHSAFKRPSPSQPDSINNRQVVGVACILAPLGEEILFRGFLYRTIQVRFGQGWAIGVSSVLFGLLHGVFYALPLALVGLMFALLRQRTGGLAAPILAHAFHNTLMVTVTLVWPEFLEVVFDR